MLSYGLACLAMWSMIETYVLLQSSGPNFGIPLDLVQSLVVLTIPKLMVKRRCNTEHWIRLLDVCWLNNLYLRQNGVSCCIMLNLLLTQQLLRAFGTHHLSLCISLNSTSSSLFRMPKIIPSEPKSTRSATSTSTTVCRSIRWEKKCCSL